MSSPPSKTTSEVSPEPRRCGQPRPTFLRRITASRRFPEYLQLRERLNLIVRSGVGNPFFAIHEGLTNDRTVIAGREYVNFSSYNYAGMSGDPLVVKAVQEAVAKYGASVSASRLVSGEKDLHRDLERALAQVHRSRGQRGVRERPCHQRDRHRPFAGRRRLGGP